MDPNVKSGTAKYLNADGGIVSVSINFNPNEPRLGLVMLNSATGNVEVTTGPAVGGLAHELTHVYDYVTMGPTAGGPSGSPAYWQEEVRGVEGENSMTSQTTGLTREVYMPLLKADGTYILPNGSVVPPAVLRYLLNDQKQKTGQP